MIGKEFLWKHYILTEIHKLHINARVEMQYKIKLVLFLIFSNFDILNYIILLSGWLRLLHCTVLLPYYPLSIKTLSVTWQLSDCYFA